MSDLPVSSALVVQTGFLGDAVLATGMVRALHAAGVARIGMLVRADAAALFEGHPALHALHRLDKRRADATAAMADELRSGDYDVALVAHRSARSTLLARRAGIPRRIGFRQSALALLHTDRVHYSIARHELERNASLVERAGIATDEQSRRSWLVAREGAGERGREGEGARGGEGEGARGGEGEGERGRGGERAIVIAPGSVWATKRWREEGYVELVRGLVARGARVVLAGGPEDRELCLRIAVSAGVSSDAVRAGEMSLGEMVSLCADAARVVSNDSAALHIAEAVGTPVTAVFGPTVPEFGFAPVLPGSRVLGVPLPCRPCRIHGGPSCPIGTHECMRSIGAADVLETIPLA